MWAMVDGRGRQQESSTSCAMARYEFSTGYKPRAMGYPPVTVITHHEPLTTNPQADTPVRPYGEMAHHAPRATSYDPLASFCLPHRGRWPQAGGGLFVRKWDVGCGRWGVENSIETDFHGPLATGHQPLFKPPPQPSPKGRGTLPDANSKPRMLRWLQTISHDYKPHATGHRPLLHRSGRRGLRPSWMLPVISMTTQGHHLAH